LKSGQAKPTLCLSHLAPRVLAGTFLRTSKTNPVCANITASTILAAHTEHHHGQAGQLDSPPQFLQRIQKEQAKDEKFAIWFETCNTTQLKALCQAPKLLVSGSKSLLVKQLLDVEVPNKLSYWSQDFLKSELKAKLLIQSGNKYERILRLLHAQVGTGDSKRAATEIVLDENTGKPMEILKEGKMTPSPKMFYIWTLRWRGWLDLL